MRTALWPHADPDELAHEAIAHFAGKAIAQVFVAESADGAIVGMLELAPRLVAEGRALSPAPFIEAWYVAPVARLQGVGRALVAAAENWARARGFTDLGSDTDLDNLGSQQAHLKLGFEEASRSVTFRKRL